MEELMENWGEAKEALLDGLTPANKEVVAQLLENQKSHMMMENAASGAVAAHDIAGFRKILIPMIRRVIPGTIATELVGVQPMTGPVGLVYSMRYQYAEAVAGTNMTDIAAGDEAFSNDKLIERFYSGETNLSTAPGAGQDAGAGGMGAPAPGDIAGDTHTGEGWGSSLDSAFTGSAGAAGPLGGGSGSFLEGSGGRKMTMEVTSQAVEAKARKLQAGWTIEAMQDANAQHGMNIETEMTKGLSAQIVQEIDNEIITDLLALAGTTQTYDHAGLPADLAPAYIGDKFANLAIVINYVTNEIGRKTRKGSGNFIVVSPMLVSVLQSAAKSVFAPAVEGSFKGPNNTMLVGTLNGRIKVYSYLWNDVQPGNLSVDTILVGYKGGNGQTDSGYFYCPYVPLMSSGTIMNPVTYQPVVSLMTRYGKAVFTNTETSLGNSSDYYGKITVNNMAFV